MATVSAGDSVDNAPDALTFAALLVSWGRFATDAGSVAVILLEGTRNVTTQCTYIIRIGDSNGVSVDEVERTLQQYLGDVAAIERGDGDRATWRCQFASVAVTTRSTHRAATGSKAEVIPFPTPSNSRGLAISLDRSTIAVRSMSGDEFSADVAHAVAKRFAEQWNGTIEYAGPRA